MVVGSSKPGCSGAPCRASGASAALRRWRPSTSTPDWILILSPMRRLQLGDSDLVCQQEKHEIISLFLFIAGRIKVGGMIGWRIRLFSLFKSMHKNGQRIKSLFRSFGRVSCDYLLKYWQFKTDHFLQEKNSWLECCRWVCVIRETLHLIS